MADSQPSSPPATCPRCGYDQRGVVATWTEQCPLAGVCSECGLKFPWYEVVASEKFNPRWCVEYATPLMDIPRACVRTAAQSIRPWRFWSRLRMAHRIRPGRLAVYLVFLLLLPLLMYVPIQASRAVAVRNAIVAQFSSYSPFFIQQASQIQSMLATLPPIPANGDQDPVSAQRQQLQGALVTAQAMASGTVTFSQSLFAAVVEAIVFPLAVTSSGSILYPGGSSKPYPGPMQFTAILASSSIQTPLESMTPMAPAIFTTILLILLLPVTFIFLPVSRRRAKVRWAHVWRITAYSAIIPVALAIICIAGRVLATIGAPWPFLWNWAQYAMLAALLSVGVWWAAAIRHYLRMPHAAAVAILMTLMVSALIAPVLFAALPPWLLNLILG